MNIKNKEKHQLRKNVNGYVAHSKTLKIPSNIFFIQQPPYSPETNSVEHIWDEIREKELYNKYFKDIKNAVDTVFNGLNRLNANSEYLKSLTNISHFYIIYLESDLILHI